MRTERDKSTGILNFSFPLKKSRRVKFPQRPPRRPPPPRPRCPRRRRHRPPLLRAKRATTKRSATRSPPAQLPETRPEANAQDVRKMATLVRATGVRITRRTQASGRPGKRGLKRLRRRRKGPKGNPREKCRPRTCPSTRMSRRTACVSRCPTAR